MYQFIFSSLLVIAYLYPSNAQTEIGIEAGHQRVALLSTSKAFGQNYHHYQVGAKVGLFLEREIKPTLGIRINLFYDFRHFDIATVNLFAYNNYHTLCLPIKTVFKPGKIVHLGIGIEPMILFSLLKKPKKPKFHIGPCGEIAFRIRKMMRLSFYCHYDLMQIEEDSYGSFTNLTLGVSFAFVLKKMKKRRVIYGPG